MFWKKLEKEVCNDASTPLLDETDSSFYSWHVIPCCSLVDLNYLKLVLNNFKTHTHEH